MTGQVYVFDAFSVKLNMTSFLGDFRTPANVLFLKRSVKLYKTISLSTEEFRENFFVLVIKTNSLLESLMHI